MSTMWALRREELLSDCLVSPDVFHQMVDRLGEFVVPYQQVLETEAAHPMHLYLQGLLSHLQRENAEDIATLVDVAMGKAVGSLIDDAELPVTIEMKVNYVEPGRPGLLLASAEVRRRGRLFTVVQAEVTQAEDGETLAEAMGTFTSTR